MAKKTIVELIDDLTGEAADATVRFGYQDKTYEIDLTETNAKTLEESLLEFIPHARVVGAATRQPRRTQQADREAITAIRKWANENGYNVKERGRVPRAIVEEYHAVVGA